MKPWSPLGDTGPLLRVAIDLVPAYPGLGLEGKGRIT